MTMIDKNWLKVNISDAERQLKHWQKRLEDLQSTARLLEEEEKKESSKQHSSEITQDDLKKYLGTFTQSKGRLRLFKKTIEREGKPMHYGDDFWEKIHALGDTIKKRSFYIILRENAEEFGLKSDGKGYYTIK